MLSLAMRHGWMRGHGAMHTSSCSSAIGAVASAAAAATPAALRLSARAASSSSSSSATMIPSAAICCATPATVRARWALGSHLQRRYLHADNGLRMAQHQPPPPPPPPASGTVRRTPNVVPRPGGGAVHPSAASMPPLQPPPPSAPGSGSRPGFALPPAGDVKGSLKFLLRPYPEGSVRPRMPLWKRLLAWSLGSAAALWLFGSWYIGATIHEPLDEEEMMEEEEEAALAHYDADAWKRGGDELGDQRTQLSARPLPLSDAERDKLLDELARRCPLIQGKIEILQSYFDEHPMDRVPNGYDEGSTPIPHLADVAALFDFQDEHRVDPDAAAAAAASADDGRIPLEDLTVRGLARALWTGGDRAEMVAKQRHYSSLVHLGVLLCSQGQLLLTHPHRWGVSDDARRQLAREYLEEAESVALQALGFYQIHWKALGGLGGLMGHNWGLLSYASSRLPERVSSGQAEDALVSTLDLLEDDRDEILGGAWAGDGRRTDNEAAADGWTRLHAATQYFDAQASFLESLALTRASRGDWAASLRLRRLALDSWANLVKYERVALSAEERAQEEQMQQPWTIDVMYVLNALPILTRMSHAHLQRGESLDRPKAANAAAATAAAAALPVAVSPVEGALIGDHGAHSSHTPSPSSSVLAARHAVRLVEQTSRLFLHNPAFEPVTTMLVLRAAGRAEAARAIEQRLDREGVAVIHHRPVDPDSDALLDADTAPLSSSSSSFVGPDGLPRGFHQVREGLSLFLHYSGLHDPVHSAAAAESDEAEGQDPTRLPSSWGWESLAVRRDCAAAYKQLGFALAAAGAPQEEVAAAHSAAASIATIQPDPRVMRQIDEQVQRIGSAAKKIMQEEKKKEEAAANKNKTS